MFKRRTKRICRRCWDWNVIRSVGHGRVRERSVGRRLRGSPAGRVTVTLTATTMSSEGSETIAAAAAAAIQDSERVEDDRETIKSSSISRSQSPTTDSDDKESTTQEGDEKAAAEETTATTTTPSVNSGDWQAIWSPAHNAYYFYNGRTGETTWINPLVDAGAAASSSHNDGSHKSNSDFRSLLEASKKKSDGSADQ